VSGPISWALLRFLLFVALAVAGPGAAVQALLRAPVERSLVLPLGFAFVAGAHWLGLVSGLPALPVLALVLDVILLYLWVRGTLRLADGPSVRGALPALLAVVGFLALVQYGGNRVDKGSGDFLLDPLVAYDTAFHVGLSHELTFSASPEVPGLAGVPLGYHLGTDLVRAALLTWARIHPYDAIARFDVTIFAVAVVLGLRALADRLGGNPRAVAFAGFTPLLADLAWLLLPDWRATWWSDLLRGNLLISLALANPVMPALALACGCLVALSRGQVWRSALPAALAAFALPFFKVFLGAHLLLGLGVAFLRSERRGPILAVAIPCAISTALLVFGTGGEAVRVSLRPLDLVATTRATLGLPPQAGLVLGAWALAWLLLSLGARLIALPSAWKAIRAAEPVATAVAVMALAGWPLGLLFHVSAPEVLPGQAFVNDAAYLVEQSGPLLWIFAALAIGKARPWILAAVVLASLPATGQLVARKWHDGWDPVPAARVRAMAALREASAPGDVVLQRPGARYPPLPVVLAGRRVPYDRFTPWMTQFAPPAVLQERHEQVAAFFRTRDAGEAAAIAARLGARYLCVYDTDRLRFDPHLLVDPVHHEPGALCGRFRRIDATR
jgi:hypothetical protein